MNTQELLCVIPYHTKDVPQTRVLLTWIEKLSPKLGPHCCLLAADSLVPHETKIELGNIAKRIFYFAETAIINVPPDITGWPKASNAMFRIASQHVQECFKLPFLWLEPDCVPLKPSWLDELALSYSRCPKRFMGAFIRSQQPPMPPVHLAGCAVYPADASKSMDQFTNGADAWDIANASYVVPRAHETPLIHHHYGTMELPPTFKETKTPGDPVNTCVLDFVREGAVLFHRVKNSTLIDLLAKRMDSVPAPATEPIIAAPAEAPAKRGPGRPRKVELVPA
jgi:hypothetical protein